MLTDPLLSELWTTALAILVNRPSAPHAGVTEDEIRAWRYAGRPRA